MRGGIKGRKELQGHEKHFGGDENVHYFILFTNIYIRQSFKYLQFIACQLYRNKAVLKVIGVEQG